MLKHAPTAIAAAIALLAYATPASAGQAIYRCTGSGGAVVFSPTPCGADAKQISAATPNAPIAAPAENAAIKAISAGREDAHCRDAARALYIEPDKSALERAERDAHQIQSRVWSGRNQYQVQMLAAQDRQALIGLQSIIAAEQGRLESARAASRQRVDLALAECDRLRDGPSSPKP